MPFCPNCGKQVSITAKFCRDCGCDLTVEDTKQGQPNESTPIQKCVQPSSEAIDGLVKDKHIQRDLNWLQSFRKQYEEVIQLRLELQSIAKEIPLLSQESENKITGGIVEKLKELQHSFADIEKSVRSGPRPKSSDLREMNRSLLDACIYFGVACVAYRKWAEQPSSSIEAYTNEKLGKARKSIDRINEQIALLSNKSAAVKDKEKVNQESKLKKQRFKWFPKSPSSKLILVCYSLFIFHILTLILVLVSPSLGFKLYTPLILANLALLLLGLYWSDKELQEKNRSQLWLVLLIFSLIGVAIIIWLSYKVPKEVLGLLTKEQEDAGLYIEKHGQFLDLQREGRTLFTFDPVAATPDYIREEAQKFVKPLGQEEVK